MRMLTMLGLLMLLVTITSGTAWALSSTCLPALFPATAQTPVFTLDLTASFGDDHARLDLWRQPCTDGTGQTVALVRVSPLSANPFMCSFNLTLIQDGVQFDTRFRSSPTNTIFCDRLFVASTFELLEDSGSPLVFNAAKPFTLISDGKTIQQITVLAIPSFIPPSSITVVSTGCNPCHSGQVVAFRADITNPGPPTSAELKGGARFPDGSVLTLLNQTTTLPSGVSSFTLVPSQALPGGLPAIDLLVEAAILDSSLGVSLSRHNVTLHLLP